MKKIIFFLILIAYIGHAQTTTVTTTTTTTTTTTDASPAAKQVKTTDSVVNEKPKSQDVSTKKKQDFRISFYGASSFPNDFETSYETKLQNNYYQQMNQPINLALIPSKDDVPFSYGLEFYIPANDRFGFSFGYKAYSEQKNWDGKISFMGQSQETNFGNGTYISYEISQLYANLQLNLSEAFHVYGGVNFPTGKLIFANEFFNSGSSMDLEGSMGFQIGAGFNLLDNLALYIQYDQLQFTPDENNDLVKQVLQEAFSQSGMSTSLELAEDYSLSVVQAGVRLDIGF